MTNGETNEDFKIVEKVLRSLPKKFDMVFISIEEFNDLSKLTLEECVEFVLSNEPRNFMKEESL